MKAPKNLTKIHDPSYNFKVGNRTFRIELANYGEEETGFFVFEIDPPKGDALTHCLLFRVKWQSTLRHDAGEYTVVMPELGQGDLGELVGSGGFDSSDCSKPQYFIDRVLARWTIECLKSNVLV